MTENFSLLVNGEPHELVHGATVASLLRSLEVDRQRVAVAVNRDVIPRSCFGEQPLREGDRVEILEAVGGG